MLKGRTRASLSLAAAAARRAICSGAPATMGSWFGEVPLAPKDSILGVQESFTADPRPSKINLGIGAYRDDGGAPVVLGAVRAAEAKLAGAAGMEYLPVAGHRGFCEAAAALALGAASPPLAEGRAALVQSLSGTGALRLFAELQARFMPGAGLLVPEPTWANHHAVWHDARVPVATYPYWDAGARALDIGGLLAALGAAAPGTVVLLHACAHNPTGVDPTPAQWAQISALMRQRRLFPLFDMAYQGFASGDADADAAAVRAFVADGHPGLALAQSFAKNMGLYGQRVGLLTVVTGSPAEAAAVESQLKAIARPIYSSPPLQGALLAHAVLTEPALRARWLGEVAGMARRIQEMRAALRGALEAAGTPGTWEHVTTQIGMFSYLGISPAQCDALTARHGVYLLRSGRISMAGVNTGNVARLAAAIHDVVANPPRE